MTVSRLSDRGKTWLRLGALSLLAASAASAQPSVGRGARDPARATVIVGCEGKGLFVGAGIPPGNTPIFARDGAVPEGVEPLPHDIFTTADFYYEVPLIGDVGVLRSRLSARGDREPIRLRDG